MQAEWGRVTPAVKIAAAGAVVLVVSLFLPWYGITLEGPFGSSLSGLDTTASGWEALELIDVLLFLAALVVIAVAAAQATGRELPVPSGRVVAGAALLALALVLYRLIDTPGPSVPAFLEAAGIDIGRRFGVFVALAAAVAMAYGGVRAAAGEAPHAAGSVPPVPGEPSRSEGEQATPSAP